MWWSKQVLYMDTKRGGQPLHRSIIWVGLNGNEVFDRPGIEGTLQLTRSLAFVPPHLPGPELCVGSQSFLKLCQGAPGDFSGESESASTQAWS